MITQAQLVKYLQSWLVAHPGTDLLALFQQNPKPFFEGIAKEPAVKTTIASVICDEIERTKGVAGVKALVNCGRGDDRYFAVVDSLAGINKENFNTRVGALLNKR